uniref:Arm DNA-binding domain-containing protein n=1 Tax=Yersinia aleksiciae TaxID=263819 RepID=UPI0021BDEC39|nr:Arm DNA-binding domain-containing protein [Yersinia aleksiciae]
MALTDVKVRSAKTEDKPYKLTDSDGMHLLVHPNGSKYWRLRYRYLGKENMRPRRKCVPMVSERWPAAH